MPRPRTTPLSRLTEAIEQLATQIAAQDAEIAALRRTQAAHGLILVQLGAARHEDRQALHEQPALILHALDAHALAVVPAELLAELRRLLAERAAGPLRIVAENPAAEDLAA